MSQANYLAILKAWSGRAASNTGATVKFVFPFGNDAGFYSDSGYQSANPADLTPFTKLPANVVTAHALCSHQIRVMTTLEAGSAAVPLIEVAAFLCDNDGSYNNENDFAFVGGDTSATAGDATKIYTAEIISRQSTDVMWPTPGYADGVPLTAPNAAISGTTARKNVSIYYKVTNDNAITNTPSSIRPAYQAQAYSWLAKSYGVVCLGSGIFPATDAGTLATFSVPAGELLARNGVPNFPVRIVVAFRNVDPLYGRTSRNASRFIVHISPCAPPYVDVTRQSTVRIANTVTNPVPVVAFEPFPVTASAASPMNVSVITGTVAVSNPVTSVAITNASLQVTGVAGAPVVVAGTVELDQSAPLEVDITKVMSLNLETPFLPVTTTSMEQVEGVPVVMPLAVTTRPWDGLFPAEDITGYQKRDTSFTTALSASAGGVAPSVNISSIGGVTLASSSGSIPVVNGDDKPLWVIEGGTDIFN